VGVCGKKKGGCPAGLTPFLALTCSRIQLTVLWPSDHIPGPSSSSGLAAAAKNKEPVTIILKSFISPSFHLKRVSKIPTL
jgi:hypothetical protein